MSSAVDSGETAQVPKGESHCSRMTGLMAYATRKEDISRSAIQLRKIAALAGVECQFVATMTDTESAIGYFRRPREKSRKWIAYHSIKMNSRGAVQHFSDLVGHKAPFRVESWNTLKQTKDVRWSAQIQGIVVCTLLERARPFLFNEKAVQEADCIIRNGPRAEPGPHPFELSGAIQLKRGVWRWPQLADDAKVEETSTSII